MRVICVSEGSGKVTNERYYRTEIKDDYRAIGKVLKEEGFSNQEIQDAAISVGADENGATFFVNDDRLVLYFIEIDNLPILK